MFRMNHSRSYSIWFRIGIFNLVLVAVWGTLMRYKYAFPLSLLDQKFLIHAHSHFAFTGWIAHVLYTGLAMALSPYMDEVKQRKYTKILILNLIAAYGMLIAFTIQGYKVVSITFSTLSLVVAGIYAYHFIRDCRSVPDSVAFKPWAKAGLLINVFSCLGPLSLAYLMITKHMDQQLVNSSIYFYLHFQYNGWFLFGAVALILSLLPQDFMSLKPYLKLWTITIFPAYLLSILFWNFPLWVVLIAGASAVIQLYVWIMIMAKALNYFKEKGYISKASAYLKFFFYTSAICISLKFIFQLVSVFPPFPTIIFNCRPLIIAYLHLILLGGYTMYIVAYSTYLGILNTSSLARFAAYLFFFGFFLNELFLFLQTYNWVTPIPIPGSNLFLFIAASIMLLGGGVLFISQVSNNFTTDKLHPIQT